MSVWTVNWPGYVLRLLVRVAIADGGKINYLVSNGILDDFAPLMDVPGSYSAQFEHVCALSLSPFLFVCIFSLFVARRLRC